MFDSKTRKEGQDTSRLPARQAFVVQFATATDPAAGRFVGRIEHMTSGQCARFASLEGVVNFVTRVLAGRISSEIEGSADDEQGSDS